METTDLHRLFLTKSAKQRSFLRFPFSLAAKFKRTRRYAIEGICRIEGGQMWSPTYRELMRRHFDVEIGTYSYGPGLLPDGLPEGTRIGNYCSFAVGILALRRNHPTNRFTQHPFFFNSALGLLKNDSITIVRDCPLIVGDDVWIGANAIITPKCRSIGIGAVIGAGAIVTKDVPAFAIVAGTPARQIGTRFSPEIQQVLLECKWWAHPIDHLVPILPLFLEDATLESSQRLRDHLRSLPI